MQATTTLAISEIINLSQGVAALNLQYLLVCVGIITLLGGVFYYFNVKPLRESLEKQENVINELKKEAQGLLLESANLTDKKLTEFNISQTKALENILAQQNENIDLGIQNRIQESEIDLMGKIESISENKDRKLREIILSESSNHLVHLSEEFTSKLLVIKSDFEKELSLHKSKTVGLKVEIKELAEDVKELQVYRYSQEGKMGAIIISIGLLEGAIDDYLKLKKEVTGNFDPNTFGWKIKNRLEQLNKEIGDLMLGEEYITNINLQIERIEEEDVFDTLIESLKIKLKS